MKKQIRNFGLAAGLASVAAFAAGPVSSAPITFTYLGDTCLTAVCVDLASAGYDASGGAVMAETITNVTLTPGSDTSPEAATQVQSYNVTSSGNSPEGAADAIWVSNLTQGFDFYWGSVDTYNFVDFFVSGSDDPIYTFSGDELAMNVLGDLYSEQRHYGIDAYVQFTGEFDSVRLRSEGIAFELATATARVPEPAMLGLLGLGLVAMGFAGRRRGGLKA